MNDTNTEVYTYQIKKNNFSKFFIIIPICIIILALLIFFMRTPSPSPKSTVESFIKAMQTNNYDKILTYIDFDGLVAFNTLNGNINNFASALEHLNNLSDSEKEINTETISYTKRYIKATLDEINRDNVIITLSDIEGSNIDNNEALNKVVVKLLIENNNTSKNETMTFYTIKKDTNYYIIDFDGEIYF